MAKWKQTNTHNVLDHGDVIKSWWSLVCCLRAVDCPLLQTWDYTVPFSSNLGVNCEMNLIMIAGWFSQPQNLRANGNVRSWKETGWDTHNLDLPNLRQDQQKTPWNSGIRTPHGQVALVVCPWQLSPEIVDGTQRLQKFYWLTFPPIVMEVKNGKSPK